MKIGIFGGTFSPIHTGHAIIAAHLMQHSDLDQLWFMVSPVNPFKEGAPQHVSDYHRLRMTELVSRRIPSASTSAFEFQLPTPSYTVDTLAALQERFPDDEFYLVIGADNWAAWDRWRRGDEIVARHHVYVYPREGYDVNIPAELASRVQLIDAPIVEVSSTAIREGLAAGHDMRFYLPDDVCDYIQAHHLYQQSQ